MGEKSNAIIPGNGYHQVWHGFPDNPLQSEMFPDDPKQKKRCQQDNFYPGRQVFEIRDVDTGRKMNAFQSLEFHLKQFQWGSVTGEDHLVSALK